MPFATLLAANLVVAVGAWVQGSVGFGLALISAPVLLLILPNAVPGPLIAAAFVLLVLSLVRERQALDPSGIGWVLAGRVPGAALGAMTLAALDTNVLGFVLGALTLLAVALSATRLRVARTPAWLLAIGAASGFMGTTAAIGGPPVALLYQHDEGHRVRASLAAYFVAGALMSMAALALAGRFGKADVTSGLALVPGVVTGFVLSGPTGKFLDRGRTRAAVLLVAGTSGALAMLRSLFF